ncbi:MAG TPA: hypothetical protein VNV86_03865 [Candidatus Acidoferrum sp.]|nr:hypothetical protein [Candidatus Acidoferrum sp.]
MATPRPLVGLLAALGLLDGPYEVLETSAEKVARSNSHRLLSAYLRVSASLR